MTAVDRPLLNDEALRLHSRSMRAITGSSNGDCPSRGSAETLSTATPCLQRREDLRASRPAVLDRGSALRARSSVPSCSPDGVYEAALGLSAGRSARPSPTKQLGPLVCVKVACCDPSLNPAEQRAAGSYMANATAEAIGDEAVVASDRSSLHQGLVAPSVDEDAGVDGRRRIER